MPSPPIAPLRSATTLVVAIVFLGLGAVGVSSSSSSVGVALPALDFLAEERGVMFPVTSASFPKVLSCFTLGVTRGGSDLAAIGVFKAVERAVGVGFPATRGVSGVLATRVEASVGLRGRALLFVRSDDIADALPVWRHLRFVPISSQITTVATYALPYTLP